MTDVLRDPVQQQQSHIGAAWFIKRAVMAVAIFCVCIGAIAWLLHASIDPTVEAKAADTDRTGQQVQLTGSIQTQ